MKTRRKVQGRNAQVERILGILKHLDRAGGTTLYELAETFGVNDKTIRRDLEALRAAGLHIEEEPGDGPAKRWRIDYKHELTKLSSLLDVSHYLALRIAMDEGGAARRVPAVFTALEDLSDKIERAVGKKGRSKLAAITSCFHSSEKFAYERSPPDVLQSLIRAISERKMCVIRHRSASPDAKEKERRALPLKLFTHAGAVYVHLAIAERPGEVLGFNLQRVRSVEVTDEVGEVPADYDPDKILSASFGVFGGKETLTYRLRFTRNVATYIRERLWHPTQTLRELPNDGVELTFTCASSPDLDGWIAAWRDDVTVIEPVKLREHLRKVGEWMRKEYAEA
jgi:predicted DNA-binding transcriptional regulator YafY